MQVRGSSRIRHLAAEHAGIAKQVPDGPPYEARGARPEEELPSDQLMCNGRQQARSTFRVNAAQEVAHDRVRIFGDEGRFWLVVGVIGRPDV